jgi:hypothetical protein
MLKAACLRPLDRLEHSSATNNQRGHHLHLRSGPNDEGEGRRGSKPGATRLSRDDHPRRSDCRVPPPPPSSPCLDSASHQSDNHVRSGIGTRCRHPCLSYGLYWWSAPAATCTRMGRRGEDGALKALLSRPRSNMGRGATWGQTKAQNRQHLFERTTFYSSKIQHLSAPRRMATFFFSWCEIHEIANSSYVNNEQVLSSCVSVAPCRRSPTRLTYANTSCKSLICISFIFKYLSSFNIKLY